MAEPSRAVRAALAALIVVVGVAGIVASQVVDGGGHPTEWDPRVEELVSFVERERKLDFDHPVTVEFLDEEAYERRVLGGTSPDDLTEEERDELEDAVAILRALGLVSGDLDLFEEIQELTTSGTLAFYDPEDEVVVVRGEELTVGVRGTIVHELTHVLQDQHFDLSRLGQLEPEELNTTFDAVVEGDASRVETAWFETLDDDEAEEYERESLDELEAFQEETDVPPAMAALFSAPYLLGEAFADVVVRVDGLDALNEALESPPTSEEHLFDPFTYLDGDEPDETRPPSPPGGGDADDEGDFGAVSWYVVLAARLDPHVALAAVDGWAGGSYSVGEQDGRACVALRYRGEDEAEAEELEAAATEWAGDDDLSLERDDDLVELVTCDPGESADEPATFEEGVLALPVSRTYVAAEGVAAGIPADAARCAATVAVADTTVEQLADPTGAGIDPQQIGLRFGEALRSCGGPVTPDQLTAGDCFDDPESDTVEAVPLVDCNGPHDNEAFHVLTLPDGPYPGDEEVSDLAIEACIGAFAPYVGVPFEESALDLFPLTPIEESWAMGDRGAICVLFDPEGKLEAPAAGSRR